MSYSLDDFAPKKTQPLIADIIDNQELKQAKSDRVKRSLLRYSSEKLAKLIISKIVR